MGITRRQDVARLRPTASSGLAGAALAWFLLFPSLGVTQKFLGTTVTLAYFGGGFLLLVILGARSWPAAFHSRAHDQRRMLLTLVALYAVLVAAFVILYPVSNSDARPWMFRSAVAGGSDRDESLTLGVRELLAGRYPYYQTTPLGNPVTQLPGSLMLAIPFALLGNAVWQSLFWLAVFFGVIRYLFGSDRLAAGFLALTVFGSPVILHDLVTGGDLGVNAITILLGMLSILRLAPNAASWKKVGAAVFTGIALSSRLNYLLLVPPLFAAVARRAGLREAFVCVLAISLAFTAVTLPFYWYDPAGFAPWSLHNKFIQFDGEVPNSGFLFPVLSLLFSAIVALYPGNRAVHVWLMQCGLVLALPVVFLVALATVRSHSPNFIFTDYALAGVFFGGMGAGLHVLHSELI
jgi:hypothetical protein